MFIKARAFIRLNTSPHDTGAFIRFNTFPQDAAHLLLQ